MKRALPVVVLTVAGLIPLWCCLFPSPVQPAAERVPVPSVSAVPDGTVRVLAGPTAETGKGTRRVKIIGDGERIFTVRTGRPAVGRRVDHADHRGFRRAGSGQVAA